MRRSIQSDPEYSLSLEKLPTVNDPPMLGVEIAFFSSIYDFFFKFLSYITIPVGFICIWTKSWCFQYAKLPI